jgi:hypothetical protein
MFGLTSFWVVMLIFQVSKPRYLILTVMALFFVLMNMLGYYRCRTWSVQELKAMQGSSGAGGFGNVVSGITSGMAQNFMVRAGTILLTCLRLLAHFVWTQAQFMAGAHAQDIDDHGVEVRCVCRTAAHAMTSPRQSLVCQNCLLQTRANKRSKLVPRNVQPDMWQTRLAQPSQPIWQCVTPRALVMPTALGAWRAQSSVTPLPVARTSCFFVA